MTPVQELYNYATLAVNANQTIFPAGNVCSFGGFLCTTAGNFNLKDATGADIIASFAVAVGYFVPAGIISGNGLKIVLTGGAAGTAYFGPAA